MIKYEQRKIQNKIAHLKTFGLFLKAVNKWQKYLDNILPLTFSSRLQYEILQY